MRVEKASDRAILPVTMGRLSLADMPDEELVQRCRQGDGAAWAALVQRYQRLVHAIVRRAGLDEHTASDVFQTVFSRLVQQLDRIGDPSRLQAWIVTTAKREAILLSQRQSRHVSVHFGESVDGEPGAWDMADDAPTAEAALDDLQQLHRLRLALDQLEPRQRDLMLMLFGDEDCKPSYEDIAATLGIPVGSIGPTRARILQKLRKLL